ncbi:MAG: hypothetical protein WCE80_15205 [Acidimicrobiia bacterium]
MIKRHQVGLSTVIVLMVLITACSTGGERALGGDGLPVQNPSKSYGHTTGEVESVLTLESTGCWTIDLGDGKRLAVFPAGFTKDETGRHMRSSDGAVVVGGGDKVAAPGWRRPVRRLSRGARRLLGQLPDVLEPAIEEFVVMDERLGVKS